MLRSACGFLGVPTARDACYVGVAARAAGTRGVAAAAAALQGERRPLPPIDPLLGANRHSFLGIGLVYPVTAGAVGAAAIINRVALESGLSRASGALVGEQFWVDLCANHQLPSGTGVGE